MQTHVAVTHDTVHGSAVCTDVAVSTVTAIRPAETPLTATGGFILGIRPACYLLAQGF